MNENTSNKNFIGYEYKEVTIKPNMESVYVDGYTNFGWTLEATATPVQPGKVMLRLKRDRKIRNKAELTRLQRQFEASVADIESLERSKTNSAAIAAFTIGIIGTAFMALSTFAMTGTGLSHNVPLSILLAVPGLIGWALPYFVYIKKGAQKTDELTPMIENKYDEVYDICEKASKLSS